MRPLLLRSAGIVGLSGFIMAVISSDALLVDSRDAPRREAAGPAEDAGPAEAAEVAAATTLRPLMPGFEAGANAFAPAPTILTREPPEERFAPIGGAPEAAPQSVPEKAIAMAAPESGPEEPASADAALLQRMTASPPEADATALGPRTAPQENAAAVVVAVAPPPPPVPEADTVDAATGSLPPDAARLPEGSQDGESIWTEHAVDCPRDWVPAPGEKGVEPLCGAATALLQPDEAEEERAAVEEAVLDHAREIGALLPRIPESRPETPAWARKQISAPRKRRLDNSWPAEAPPNCGSKHAYWRFVDRKAGTKEWYCK